MATSAALVGGYTPNTVRVTGQPDTTSSDNTARITTAQADLAVFLKERQGVNLGFDPGTAGDSTYLTGVDDQMITRGFIRRAVVDSGDVMSTAQLNFMYNPEQIVRDYVSYLDQQALDPFNTVYGSGNLIAPPSFINFSFELFFDRQVQTSNGQTERGVLEDYDFFDIVVRNVSPGGRSTVVPDNGIMMVNPKDIVVVFSKYLTVQGRPTNASVTFERFNSKMTPTRMTVSLTMIITYFGPLQNAFALGASVAPVSAAQGTVPYSEIYTEEFTQADADAAKAAFDKSRSSIAGFVNAIPRQVPFSMAATTGAGVSAVAAGAASDLSGKTLGYALSPSGIIGGGGTAYTQGAGRTNLPVSADCSGALWRCYNQFGGSVVLHGSTGPATTASIAAHGRQTNWSSMVQVANPATAPLAQLKQLVRPGDVVLRSPSNGHCGFFNSWINPDPNNADGTWKITHQTDAARNGTYTTGLSYLRKFNWILRPNPSGSTTSTGSWPTTGGDPNAA